MNTTRTLLSCFVAAFLFTAAPASAQQPDPYDPGYEAWKMEESGVEGRAAAPQALARPEATATMNPAKSMSPLVPYPGSGGWAVLPKNDDGSTGIFSLPFTFELYGSTYDEICVNNNGNVSFEECYSTFDPVGFPSDEFVMVAPFWADVDTCDPGDDCTGEVAYKTTTLNGETVFVAHWEEVGFYFENESLRNTFQVVIADGPTLPGGNNVCFGYGDMNWTTGDASGGEGGFGGDPATVGANEGDGVSFFQYGRFDHPGSDYDGPSGTTDGVDHLDSRQICFNTGAAANNVPPVIVSEPGAPIMVSAGDPISFSVEFIPPESDQGFASTNVALNGGITFADLDCNTTFGPDGGVTTVDCSGSVDTPGSYSVDITGTDDGSPPLSTSTTVEIEVEAVDTSCPTDLVISDFRTAPNAQEFVDLTNVGAETIDFSEVDCVLGGFRSASYVSLPATGTLAPGEALRFGASGTGADVAFPDGTLFDAYASLALLDRESLPNGTSIPAVQDDLVTSLVYLAGSNGSPQVFGFYHADDVHEQLYCTYYAGELHPYGQSLCTATAARGANAEGGIEALDFAAMMEAALAEEARTASAEATVPTAFALHAAYPNPLRSATSATVALDVAEAAEVRVVVYDVLGRAVAVLMDEAVEAGRYEVAFDASGLASGTYVVRMTAGTFTQTQRLTVVR